MQTDSGCLLNSFANIDRINLTEQDKIRISKNESHYCVGIVAVLLVNQAHNLHCSSSAITLQAAVPFFSSKHGGKRPLSAAPFTSEGWSPLEGIQNTTVARGISLRIGLSE